jgi:hypothetical protein
MARILIVLVALLLGGCNVNRNVDCQWGSDHRSGPLDLSTARDRRHLADDAQVAEDLAIRHADASRPPDWQRDRPAYQRVREACRARLNLIVAQQHFVPIDAVDAAVNDRREWLDAVVIASLASLFLMATRMVVRFLMRGALADAPVLATAMFIVVSLGAGAVLSLGSNVFIGSIESIRVGNGHMSYRTERLPLRQRPVETFAAGAIGFVAVAAMQYRRRT